MQGFRETNLGEWLPKVFACFFKWRSLNWEDGVKHTAVVTWAHSYECGYRQNNNSLNYQYSQIFTHYTDSDQHVNTFSALCLLLVCRLIKAYVFLCFWCHDVQAVYLCCQIIDCIVKILKTSDSLKKLFYSNTKTKIKVFI